VGGAYEQHVANLLRHQLDPSIDQRFHQHFANLGVSLNEGVHLVACQLDDFTRLADAKAHQRRATEDHADITSELIRMNNGDQEVAQNPRDGSPQSRQPSQQKMARWSGRLDQHFPARDLTNHFARGNPRDLRNSASET
jgi:hypothetical protein